MCSFENLLKTIGLGLEFSSLCELGQNTQYSEILFQTLEIDMPLFIP